MNAAEEDDAETIPDAFEFHAHRPKLWILCGATALAAAWLLSFVFSPPAGGADPLALGAAMAALLLASFAAGRAAADPRPVLRVDRDGLEDRLHGRIPWSDLESWSMRRSMIAPGFGWSLKAGRQPPQHKRLFRLQAALNALSMMPQRSYRRKLLAGGAEPIANAFRVLKPELER